MFVIDFIEKLKKNPKELEILGDGEQCKSFLLVAECVDAILYAIEKSKGPFSLYNIASGDNIKVFRIARIITGEMGFYDCIFRFTGGKRGWRGDVPLMLLCVDKPAQLGWNAKHNSEDAIRLGIKELLCRQ